MTNIAIEKDLKDRKREILKSYFSKFVYGLLYPGILGSLIYGFVDGVINPLEEGAFIAKFCIVILFCLDFLYLKYVVVNHEESKPSWLDIFFDALSAIMFQFAFVFVVQGNLLISSSILLGLWFVLILYHYQNEYLRKGWSIMTYSLLLVANLPAIFYCICMGPNIENLFAMSLFLQLLIYAAFVMSQLNVKASAIAEQEQACEAKKLKQEADKNKLI